jgi:hypothetical protein
MPSVRDRPASFNDGSGSNKLINSKRCHSWFVSTGASAVMELAIFIVRCFPSGNNGAMVKAGQRSTSNHVFTFEYSVLFPCVCRFFSYHVSFLNVSALLGGGHNTAPLFFSFSFSFIFGPYKFYWLIKKNSNYQKSPII